MVVGKNGRSFEAGGETDPTPLTDEVKKKKSVCLRPHDRSENFYDARYSFPIYNLVLLPALL
jgi:hypothetical protein